MNSSNLIPRLMLVLLAVLLAADVQAAAPAKTEKTAKAKPVQLKQAQVSLREVDYSSLESKVGSKLVIDTVNNTTRSGTLLRYTNVSIIVKLGADSGSIELGMPRKTIRKIMLEIPPADPLFINETSPHEGKPGAKKN